MKLYIGNKNYSSWSLRAWLCLRLAGIDETDVEIVRVPLYVEGYKEKLLEHSPGGRVPALIVNEKDSSFPVWDSMAIMEFILEEHPANAVGWPSNSNKAARATARSISAEFHSGFLGIRDELPQNLKVRRQLSHANLSDSCHAQIDRVNDIWTTCLSTHGGPWLFGTDLTIADLFYIPVALRFLSYGMEGKLSEQAKKYLKNIKKTDLIYL